MLPFVDDLVSAAPKLHVQLLLAVLWACFWQGVWKLISHPKALVVWLGPYAWYQELLDERWTTPPVRRSPA